MNVWFPDNAKAEMLIYTNMGGGWFHRPKRAPIKACGQTAQAVGN
jgi:hypothetical protein